MTGLAHLQANAGSILVFSGGPTKTPRTSLSEAQSYHDLALANKFFGHVRLLDTEDGLQASQAISSRCFLDQYATDSFQNVLFPLLQFPDYVKVMSWSNTTMTDEKQPRWPTNLVVIGHEFKRRRFIKLHIPAVKFPRERVKYIGVDPPFDEARMAEVVEGDARRGYGVWKDDLYGKGALPQEKREQRGWNVQRMADFHRDVMDPLKDAERQVVTELMEWRGPDIFPGSLPWELE